MGTTRVIVLLAVVAVSAIGLWVAASYIAHRRGSVLPWLRSRQPPTEFVVRMVACITAGLPAGASLEYRPPWALLLTVGIRGDGTAPLPYRIEAITERGGGRTPSGLDKFYEKTLNDVTRYLHWRPSPGWPGISGGRSVNVQLTDAVMTAEITDSSGASIRLPDLAYGDILEAQ